MAAGPAVHATPSQSCGPVPAPPAVPCPAGTGEQQSGTAASGPGIGVPVSIWPHAPVLGSRPGPGPARVPCASCEGRVSGPDAAQIITAFSRPGELAVIRGARDCVLLAAAAAAGRRVSWAWPPVRAHITGSQITPAPGGRRLPGRRGWPRRRSRPYPQQLPFVSGSWDSRAFSRAEGFSAGIRGPVTLIEAGGPSGSGWGCGAGLVRPCQELAGAGSVTDGGRVVEAEHHGEVERVGAVGKGFLELPVDAQPVQGGRESSQASQPSVAGGPRDRERSSG